ncbi:UDP-N-acetylglucosamine 2-epimerase (non-hydrolyzing) [Parvibaculaceae bacterium PLY_AMNH_Bact1]|nr:UDP-N-acetylglucosamine 2-epimerase (non-hydrolyzing) [Parvibaculaceae bacterium PLY_AMNH_Bact1]
MAFKVVSVVGARPQFVKAAVVSRILGEDDAFSEVMIHTGQHYDDDMSDIFFRELNIPAPSYNLSIGSSSHGAQTGRMLQAIEEVLLEEKPDWVLVYGDTNSTLAGALAASKIHIPVAHVEAGLRSFNKRMPEEQNRIVADHLSTLLLTPTKSATENLLSEGVAQQRVEQIGDVMFDATLFAQGRARSGSSAIERHGLEPGGYVLSTIHRAENTDSLPRLEAILHGLASVAQQLPVVLPLHPRTRKLIQERPELEKASQCLRLLEPVGYFDMVDLEAGAAVIATDSGGVQKEAYFNAKPCVTLRDETEWVELVELGWNRLQPPASAELVEAAILGAIGTEGTKTGTPYGQGQSGGLVAAAIKKHAG